MRLVCCWGVLFTLTTLSIAQAQSYRDSLGIRVAFDFSAPNFGESASPPELPAQPAIPDLVDAGKAIGSGLKDGASVAAKSQPAMKELATSAANGFANSTATSVPVPTSAHSTSPLRLPASEQPALAAGSGPARPVIMRLPFAEQEQIPLEGRDPVIDSMVEPTLVPRPDYPAGFSGIRTNQNSEQNFFSSTESTPAAVTPSPAVPTNGVNGVPQPSPVAEPVGIGRFNLRQRRSNSGFAVDSGAKLQFRQRRSSQSQRGYTATPTANSVPVSNEVVESPRIPAPRVIPPGSQPQNTEGARQLKADTYRTQDAYRTKNVAMPQAAEKITIPQQGTVDMGDGPMLPSSTGFAEGMYRGAVNGCATPPARSKACDAPGMNNTQSVATCDRAPQNCDVPRPAFKTPLACDCGDDCDSSCGGCCTGRKSTNRRKPICKRPAASKSSLAGVGCGDAGSTCDDCGKSSCLGGCCIGKLAKYMKLNPKFNLSGWFAGGYYLNLRRDDDTIGMPLASSGGANVLSSGLARMEPANGLARRVGKMLNENTAFEVIYWLSFPDDERATVNASSTGNPINANVVFGSLNYDNGGGAQPLDTFFQGAESMSVSRYFDYRNFEVNVLRLPFSLSGCGKNGKTNLALVAGVRYFQAEEGMDLFSDLNNEIRGDDPDNELNYSIDTTNDLLGVQVGGLLNYQLTSKLYCQFGTKVGLYNNHMEQRQAIGSVNRLATSGGQGFDVTTDKDDIAFLAELDAGIAYSLNDNWRLTAGYKMLAISSYADASSQVLNSFTIGDAGQIMDNNSLILHGLFIGAEYAW